MQALSACCHFTDTKILVYFIATSFQKYGQTRVAVLVTSTKSSSQPVWGISSSVRPDKDHFSVQEI